MVFYRIILDALEEYGIPTLTDSNNGRMAGGAIIPNTLSPENQTRFSPRSGYYDGFIDSCPNSHFATGLNVIRLLLNQPDFFGSSEIWVNGVEMRFVRE